MQLMELLERKIPLQELEASLQEVIAGNGRFVLISGEAGIGKTSLVEQFVHHQKQRLRVFWGACDALFTPRPLGPLHDIASQVEGKFATLFRAETDRFTLFSACLQEFQTSPTIVVFEDIHWADEATLDLLKFLGRRIQRTTILLIATYRDDELSQQHPLRLLLGDLATAEAIRRIALAPLSVEAVRHLAAQGPINGDTLHQQTGGNPFFVTEVLAAGEEGVPSTVRDAVLARAARLSLSARAVLNAAAVIGVRVEPWLLAEVTRAEAGKVDESLALGILLIQGDMLAFRHELGQRAILDAIPPHQRVFLHRAVLDALKASPTGQKDLARLVHHAEAAGDGEAVLEYAPSAARQAVAANAHHQAATLYALTLRFAEDFPSGKRAQLLESYARELALIEKRSESLSVRRQAADLWRQAGNPLKQGENLTSLVFLLIGMGQNREAEETIRAAIQILETLPPGQEVALAYSTRSALSLFNRNHAQAIAWGEKSIALLERLEHTAALVGPQASVGAAWMFLDFERGCAYLERTLATARSAGQEIAAANILARLGAHSCELYHFHRAERYLTEGIAYAIEYDIDYLRFIMLAWQALMLLHLGRWGEAAKAAGDVLQRSGVSAISQIWALIALGRLQARQGNPEALTKLNEALEVAEPAGSVQHLGLARVALAEAAWLAGNAESVLENARATYDLAVRKQHPWIAGELAFWLWKAGETVDIHNWMARPYTLHIAGDWQAAAAAWEALGCPYEQARALADGDSQAQIAALVILEQLGAQPMIEITRQKLRAAGVQTIPQGPRAATRENPFGLTNRQLEILTLLTENLTNAEIAARLHISPKTAGHHVSAVLAKLDVSSREKAADLARQHPDF